MEGMSDRKENGGMKVIKLNQDGELSQQKLHSKRGAPSPDCRATFNEHRHFLVFPIFSSFPLSPLVFPGSINSDIMEEKEEPL